MKLLVLLPLVLAGCAVQPPPGSGRPMGMAMGDSPVPGGCEAPAMSNQGKAGCYFDAEARVGRLGGAAYWHVDEFTDLSSARVQRVRGSAVVFAYGRFFLQTVNSDLAWSPRGGRRLATVGPMPVPSGVPLTARFMQAMTPPGVTTRPHAHSGPEAFYLLDGAICMETPAGVRTTSRGQTYWVEGGSPMQLTSAPGGIRRSLLVVVHPTGQPWMTVAPGWQPRGACTRGG